MQERITNERSKERKQNPLSWIPTKYDRISQNQKMQEAFPLLVDYYQTSKEKYKNPKLLH